MGFDTETIQMNDVYNVQDFRMGKFRIKDMHRHDGYNTVPQMFMNSSNIGAGFIALEVGKKRFKEYMTRFDFTKQLPIEIPERAMPLVPPDSRWSDLGLITMSYGYGFSMSPLHYIQGIIPILNGGQKYPVTLLKREGTPVAGEKVLSEETSMKMIKLLRLTVEKGTGKKAAVKGYLVAGKTGTAEKLDSKKGVYSKNHRFSSFVATAPAINPKFVVYIFLDDPRGIKETFGFATAGWTAAPVAGNIISKIGSLYGIDPIDEDDEKVKEMMHVDYEIESDT
jgi:cell division protein FtsI (penicillin-binding protein 3)